MGCVKGSPVTQSWVLWEEFLAVQGFALQCGAAISALQRAGAVSISMIFSLQVCLEVLLSPPKQADKSLFVINCMFGHVINQYLNPTEEPHKPGTKEKRKKAASFQTVSQLHKVRARPSSKPTREACSEHPSINPTSLPRLQGTLHTNSWALKNPKASRELSWLGKSS